MKLRELIKRRKRRKEAEDADKFANFYVSTYDKQRPKPQDKMRRRHEDK